MQRLLKYWTVLNQKKIHLLFETVIFSKKKLLINLIFNNNQKNGRMEKV